MTKYGDFYHCSLCGHVISILHEGAEDSLVCCGQKMERLEAKTADSSTEKHVPVVVPERRQHYSQGWKRASSNDGRTLHFIY